MSALCSCLTAPGMTSAAVLSTLTRQILGLIKANPGMSKKNLEAIIQAKGGDTVALCLRKLVDMNEIKMRMVGASRCYWPVESEPPLLQLITNKMIRRGIS